MEKEKKSIFVGIDLGGKTKATTGLCFLQEFNDRISLFQTYCQRCHDLKPKEILSVLRPYLKRIRVIAIDGPLTEGKGKGLMRLWEKFLSTKIFRQEKVTPLPPALIPSLTEIGQELVKKFETLGFILDRNLIETFPTIVKKMCPQDFPLNLSGSKIKEFPCKSSNQKDAFLCAVVAWLHSNFKTRYLGYKDGFLFLPQMSFWKKDWHKKFYQAWRDRDYLKFRYLITNIFERGNEKGCKRDKSLARAHVFVSGMVQGVFFRANTEKRAKSKNLRGWVKNVPDGRVEAVFEGEKQRIEEMIDWMRHGPRFAGVEDIEVRWEEYEGEFKNFEIKY